MKKLLTAAAAALTLAGGAMATATPASADGWRGGYHGGGYYHGGYRGGGGAVLAGIAGLAIGAAIASPHYYGHPAYYGRGYGYYGYAPYGVCYATRQVWDPYVGGYVVQRYSYGC
jgi:hypothetical protein